MEAKEADMTRLERKLLRHGTWSFPVSPAMIALAKDMYEKVCRKLNHKMAKDGWEDFISVAREELEAKEANKKETPKDNKR